MSKQRHYNEQELSQLLLLGRPGDNPEAYEVLAQKLGRPALGLSAKWYKLTRIERLKADGVIPSGTTDATVSCDCDTSLLLIMERLDSIEHQLDITRTTLATVQETSEEASADAARLRALAKTLSLVLAHLAVTQ